MSVHKERNTHLQLLHLQVCVPVCVYILGVPTFSQCSYTLFFCVCVCIFWGIFLFLTSFWPLTYDLFASQSNKPLNLTDFAFHCGF